MSRRIPDFPSGGYVPDGLYWIFPRCEAWSCVEYRSGHLVDQTDASRAETHRRARDLWSYRISRMPEITSDMDFPAGEVSGRVKELVLWDVVGQYADCRPDPALFLIVHRQVS